MGKSTLLNRLLGEKLSIVTPKPQTTRNRIMGIKTYEKGQILFLDTPGIHRARSLLNQRMVDTAKKAIGEVDAALWVLDARGGVFEEDEDVAAMLEASRMKALILLNKLDRVARLKLLPLMERCAELLPDREIIPISARTGQNVDLVPGKVLELLPVGPRYFPDDELTDQTERFIVAEMIREKVFLRTREEIPYGTAVTIHRFEERQGQELIFIAATVHVERDSQKPILIGKKGVALREVGKQAREELEAWLGRKVYLELSVKVTRGWSRDSRSLAEFGL